MHIGDKVRFKHQTGEGVIQKLLPGQRAEVLMDDDFELEFPLSELVVVAREEKIVFGKQGAPQDEETKPSKPKAFAKEGVYAALQADEDSLYTAYLVNNSDFRLACSIKANSKNRTFEPLKLLILEPKTAERIHRFPGGHFGNLHFQFEILFYDDAGRFERSPLQHTCKLKPKKMIRGKSAIPIVQGKGYVFKLDEQKNTPQKPKETPRTSKNPAQLINLQKPAEELDLHIEKLLGKEVALPDQKECLQIQLDTFEKHFYSARAAGLSSVLYIHGFGKQKLQRQIHKWLERNKHMVERYQLEGEGNINPGATRVWFR